MYFPVLFVTLDVHTAGWWSRRSLEFSMQRIIIQAFFLDNFPQYLPTRNWRILEFWAKFLEFFVKILEFFLKILEFFSKTLEFYNQGGLFNWNLEFYPSIFSFSLNVISFNVTSILVIMTKLLLFYRQKGLF